MSGQALAERRERQAEIGLAAVAKVDAEAAAAQRREEEEILDLYMSALGMLSDLPLGQAAVDRAFPRRVA